MRLIEYVFNCISNFPSVLSIVCIMFVALCIWLIATVIIMILHEVTDAFSVDHIFDPLRVYHFIFVFPIMCLFMLIRFGIQRRDKMEFDILEFTKWEAALVRKLGYSFNEEYTTVQYQNNFGAKWEGADCTTTVYRVPPVDDSWPRSINSGKRRYR